MYRNIVADALSRIREVNMLSFTEITSDLYDHLRGKYPNDSYFAKYWARVEPGIDTTTSSKESFHIANGLLYRNGKSVFQICLRSKREFFLNAMMHPPQGTLEYIVHSFSSPLNFIGLRCVLTYIAM